MSSVCVTQRTSYKAIPNLRLGMSAQHIQQMQRVGTWALLFTARPDLVPGALARVSLQSCSLTHPVATLPATVTCLGAQAPMIPRAPFSIS